MISGFKNIPGIGPKTQQKLQRLDIKNSFDLILHFPRKYIDFRHIVPIADLQPDHNVTIEAQINSIQNIRTKTGKNIQIAKVSDSSGHTNLIWFNQPYILKTLKAGQTQKFAGAVSLYQGRPTIMVPIYGSFHTASIIPIYPETQGLGSKWFRKTIQTNLDRLTQNITDPLPSAIRQKYHLLSKSTALVYIHQPPSPQKLQQARIRLKIDEILSLQAQSHLKKLHWQTLKPQHHLSNPPSSQTQIKKLINSLPFKLTKDQLKVWHQIQKDLLSPTSPANRLIQGDVGSGKTILALLACFLTHLNNHLSLFIAPTEILAKQHYQTFTQLLKPFKVPIKLLTGQTKTSKITPNSIVIATHAAIYQKQNFKNQTALLIIDEQHKFGVKQRQFLSSGLAVPHTITMTATPIPRTISLTLLGHLDMSVITTMPKNRLPVKTFLVPQSKKDDCYQWTKNQIKKNHTQAFIVCPIIEESTALADVKSATQEFKILSRQVFPHLKLALIHSQTPTATQHQIIKKFQQNQINILVTTPIIEVGVDIKNASIIIIQSADRFGLAQLHQLRGRVGRGSRQSYCYLFTQNRTPKAINRLKYIQKHHQGLKIAQYDLKNRGPGEVFSTLQHGFPSLKLAHLNDNEIIDQSRLILTDLIQNYPHFPLKNLLNFLTTTSKKN